MAYYGTKKVTAYYNGKRVTIFVFLNSVKNATLSFLGDMHLLELNSKALSEFNSVTPDIPTVERLTAPTISINLGYLIITATDSRTERFVIIVDGVETVITTDTEYSLRTLCPNAGSYQIKVIARAYDYPDSFPSNSVMYEHGLIQFAIDDVAYSAVEGMLWSEWLENEYSNGRFVFNVDYNGINISPEGGYPLFIYDNVDNVFVDIYQPIKAMGYVIVNVEELPATRDRGRIEFN